MLNLIEEFIEKMNLSKSKYGQQREENDLKQKFVNELLQCLKEDENNNDNKHLFKIIEEMNQKVKSSKIQKKLYYKQYSCSGYELMRCQLNLNQNAKIFIFDCGLHEFSNNLKLIKKFIGDKRQLKQIIPLTQSEQILLRFDEKLIICNNKWEPQQTLEGHFDIISSLIVNDNENLIIFGSEDRTIKFWKKDNSFWICQQTLITEFKVVSLSLNSNQTKLILCGTLPIILVVEFQNDDNQWVIAQKLKVDIHGEYVSFINNNQFMFHPQGIGLFQIFNYQNEAKQFIEGKLLMISNRQSRQGHIHQFNTKSKVLILSFDYQLYVYHFQENRDYELKHQIKFKKVHSLKNFLHQNQLIVIKKYMKCQSQIILIQLRSII